MPFITVRVSKPSNRLIYINGDYSAPAGNSSTDSFTVPTAGQIFETLTRDRRIDYRKKFRVRPGDTEITVELDRINPQEPI